MLDFSMTTRVRLQIQLRLRAYARRGNRAAIEHLVDYASAHFQFLSLSRHWYYILRDLTLAGHDAVAQRLIETRVPMQNDETQQQHVHRVVTDLCEQQKWQLGGWRMLRFNRMQP